MICILLHYYFFWLPLKKNDHNFVTKMKKNEGKYFFTEMQKFENEILLQKFRKIKRKFWGRPKLYIFLTFIENDQHIKLTFENFPFSFVLNITYIYINIFKYFIWQDMASFLVRSTKRKSRMPKHMIFYRRSELDFFFFFLIPWYIFMWWCNLEIDASCRFLTKKYTFYIYYWLIKQEIKNKSMTVNFGLSTNIQSFIKKKKWPIPLPWIW